MAVIPRFAVFDGDGFLGGTSLMWALLGIGLALVSSSPGYQVDSKLMHDQNFLLSQNIST